MNFFSRERETERDRERQKETERDRERQRETDRDRERDGQRDRERQRELNGLTSNTLFQSLNASFNSIIKK